MRFTRIGTGRYVSECGDYEIWVQARPRDESPYWAAMFRNEKPWLCETQTKYGVRQVCLNHKASRNPK